MNFAKLFFSFGYTVLVSLVKWKEEEPVLDITGFLKEKCFSLNVYHLFVADVYAECSET
jgi:hypothetical protein